MKKGRILIGAILFWGCTFSAADKQPIMNTATKSTMKSNVEKYTADHIAIRELLDQYNDIVNHRSWGSVDKIFDNDAIWEAKDPINLRWSGLADIKVKLPASVQRMEVLIQTTSGVVIDVETDSTAKARSLLTEFGRNKDTQEGMHSVGSYEDALVKKNGEWKFINRTLTLIYNDQLPVPGGVEGYKY